MSQTMHTPLGRRRARKKYAVDLAIWTTAGILAFPIRLPTGWVSEWPTVLLYALVTLPIKAGLLAAFRLYRQTYRQVTVQDLVVLLQAVGIAVAASFVIGLAWHDVAGFPRGLPLIEGLVAIAGLGGVRLLTRILVERGIRPDTESARRVLLVGAGSAGARIAREIRRHPRMALVPVGFLDNDPRLARLSVGGLRVLGAIEDLPTIAREQSVDEVLISMPSSPGRVVRRIAELARKAELPVRVLPGIQEILSGDVTLSRLREVQVDDLLRREPVEIDVPEVANLLEDQVVLVTGAGGSIGSELVRQVARVRPKRIVLLGQGENSLYGIAHELGRDLPDQTASIVVGSVRDRRKMEEVLERFRPDVVFHAAAHKHVSMLEDNPDEAILNNLGGTKIVAEAALNAGIANFVNISTDKAVNPISMLGVSKALAEMVVRSVAAQATNGQVFASVRFGNVLGSRGSVVPLFDEQIREGGPVTVTHPEMTRYFMTIPEASRLVIQAGAFGRNGAVYVLDMGTPVSIVDLANDMIRLSGADEDEIEIVFKGLRPGEKLAEELFTKEEQVSTTRYEKILIARCPELSGKSFLLQIDRLILAAERRDMPALEDALATLVPGFRPDFALENVTAR
jgi:FlaA1/EpsC-like NDP-sugar epimerase